MQAIPTTRPSLDPAVVARTRTVEISLPEGMTRRGFDRALHVALSPWSLASRHPDQARYTCYSMGADRMSRAIELYAGLDPRHDGNRLLGIVERILQMHREKHGTIARAPGRPAKTARDRGENARKKPFPCTDDGGAGRRDADEAPVRHAPRLSAPGASFPVIIFSRELNAGARHPARACSCSPSSPEVRSQGQFTPEKISMSISNTFFRRAEAVLDAAKIDSADALMTVVALALETMAPPPHPGDAGIPDPITIRVAALAERLGWTPASVDISLLHASEEIRAALGFRLFSHDLAEGEESGAYTSTKTPIRVRLSGQLTSILRGTALLPVGREDPQALALDGPSMAALDLVACCSESGGGAFLLRETETAGDRDAELHAITATIANHPRIGGNVVITGPVSTVEDRVSPAAAILSAVLHGAGAIVLTDPLFDQPADRLGDADTFDENDQPRRGPAPHWQPSSGGTRALKLLPHVPVAVIVPVARDIVLAPSAAAAFVTALGPLRRDRVAAIASVRALAAGRLGEAAADRLVDLWDARSERAKTSLDIVGRMIDGPTTLSTRQRMKRRAFIRGEDAKIDATAFSTMAEAMAIGIAPHVWAPMKRQGKAPVMRFHRELFVSEPHESFLFSEKLRQIRGVRILLSGEPGTGKTAAAACVATEVLGKAARDLRVTEVLYHRLGALERAIAASFREAREQGAVLIVDEADSIAQDRGSASSNSVHLVTAMTNSLLLELDRHTLPVILCTNHADRLDAAIRRRVDLAFEVQPIPADREPLAARLLLDLDLPVGVPAMGGTVVADYVVAKRGDAAAGRRRGRCGGGNRPGTRRSARPLRAESEEKVRLLRPARGEGQASPGRWKAVT